MDTRFFLSVASILAAAVAALSCDVYRARQLRRKPARAPASEPEVDREPTPLVRVSTPAAAAAVEAPPKLDAEARQAQVESLVKRAAARAARKVETPSQSGVVVNEAALRSLFQPSSSGLQRVEGSGGPGNQLAVTGGLQSAAELARLLESVEPFSGLVISIAVTNTDSRPGRDQDRLTSIQGFILGLLRPSDALCPCGPGEFVTVCPGLSGPRAQESLSSLAERLWNFQLNALGTSAMGFTVGGAEGQGQPLREAVAAARERNQGNAAARKPLMMPQPGRSPSSMTRVAISRI